MKSIILNINNIPTKCKDLDWETTSDNWVEIRLEDGNLMKLKLIPIQIIRVGEAVNEVGLPQYNVLWNPVYVTLVPAQDSIDHDTVEATRV